jgi:hypothetical protein
MNYIYNHLSENIYKLTECIFCWGFKMWSFSKIESGNLKAITDLESKLGITLIAFSDEEIEYVDLNEDAAKEVKDLEKKLGLSLLALKA